MDTALRQSSIDLKHPVIPQCKWVVDTVGRWDSERLTLVVELGVPGATTTVPGIGMLISPLPFNGDDLKLDSEVYTAKNIRMLEYLNIILREATSLPVVENWRWA